MNSLKQINKKNIGWGADLTFRYCHEYFPIKINYFIDNNKAKQGEKYNNIDIFPPSQLSNEKDFIIIIFTTYFIDIKIQLEKRGLKYKKDFFQFLDFIEYKDLIGTICREKDYMFLDKIISEGDYCIDIGANSGLFTYKMSKKVKNSGHVFSFEPIKNTFLQLKKYIDMYSLSNCTAYNVALVEDSEIKEIEMIVPTLNNHSRTGTAHIKTKEISRIKFYKI